MLNLRCFPAKLDGGTLTLRGGYRSEETSAAVYVEFLAEGGQEYAGLYVGKDLASAGAGCSDPATAWCAVG